MALLSKSSIRINTTLNSHYSVKCIYSKDCISSLSCCHGDWPLSQLTNETNSKNINGPYSGSVRVCLHT